ncbi:hypothetical protein SRHO_G00153410 [Serrasalmus rhombeus]
MPNISQAAFTASVKKRKGFVHQQVGWDGAHNPDPYAVNKALCCIISRNMTTLSRHARDANSGPSPKQEEAPEQSDFQQAEGRHKGHGDGECSSGDSACLDSMGRKGTEKPDESRDTAAVEKC